MIVLDFLKHALWRPLKSALKKLLLFVVGSLIAGFAIAVLIEYSMIIAAILAGLGVVVFVLATLVLIFKHFEDAWQKAKEEETR